MGKTIRKDLGVNGLDIDIKHKGVRIKKRLPLLLNTLNWEPLYEARGWRARIFFRQNGLFSISKATALGGQRPNPSKLTKSMMKFLSEMNS